MLLYCRTMASIRLLPKFLMFYYCSFNLYFYCTHYGFYYLAIGINFFFSLQIILHFLLHFEIPAVLSGRLSIERPRGMMNTVIGPVLNATLPPSWSFFLPLNYEFNQTLYNQDTPELTSLLIEMNSTSTTTNPSLEGEVRSSSLLRETVYTPLRDNDDDTTDDF